MADNRNMENRPPDLSDPEQRFEHRDVNIWAIGKVGIGLILTTIASLFLVVGVFRYLEMQEKASQPPPRVGVNVNAPKLPPEPRLLDNEPEDLRQMRSAEEQFLNGYGWADPQHTIAKVPIALAIDLLAQHGLPSRAQSAPGASNNVSMPTESGLGPKMQQPGGPLASPTAAASSAPAQESQGK